VKDTDARAYLLGQAAPADADRLEDRLMEDHDAYETMRAVEDDLFDAYVRGHLTPADRQAFEARFGGERERIAFARALAERAPRQRTAWPAARLAAVAAAAVLAVAVGAIWLTRDRAPVAPASAGDTRPAAPAPAPAVPSVVALVTLSASRAASGPPAIALPAGESELRLRVRLNPADRFDAYTMELRSTADRVVWQAADLRATSEGGDLFVVGTVPSSALASGSYELAVRGGTADLGFVTITINRMP
jgi:hypothetical protein